jgi:formamidopyrimidine-DNA glycosylase
MELPQIEVYRTTLEKSFLNQQIHWAWAPASRVLQVSNSHVIESLVGRHFLSVRRHGKYLFIEVSDQAFLVIHIGLNGSLQCYEKSSMTSKHARLILQFANGAFLAYVSPRVAGKVDITSSPEDYIKKAELGPDALSVSSKEFVERMESESKEGAVKLALMNQSIIAGIGNVYADEILFQRKLHPDTPVASLDTKALTRLHKKCQAVLQKAVDLQGDHSSFPNKWINAHIEDLMCPRRGCNSELSRVDGYPRGQISVHCPSCQRGSSFVDKSPVSSPRI